MRIIKKIMIFPILVVLDISRVLLDLFIKAECWVAGVGFLLLAILSIIALLGKMWLQLFVFGVLVVIGAMVLLFSANILMCIEALRNWLREAQ